MPSLDTLCNLAYVKNVSTTELFTVELDFQSRNTDLSDIRIKARGIKNSVRDKSTLLNVYIFQRLKAVAAQFYRKSTGKVASFTVNGPSTVYIACREMACRKMVDKCGLCT